MNPQRGVPGPGLPILLALVFANLLGGGPRGERPWVAPAPTPPVRELEATPARLWQDPLAAAYAHRVAQKGDERLALPEELRRRDPVAVTQLCSWCDEGGELTVIAVMQPGGNRAEQHELRLRQRHAVVSALMCSELHGHGERERCVQGDAEGEDGSVGRACEPERLSPLDPEHLGLARLGPPECDGRGSETGDRPILLLPFERLQSERRRVLVLWVDERAVQDRPLHWMGWILESVVPEARRSSAELRIVGPGGSDMLLRMRADDAEWGCCPDDHGGVLGRAVVISPHSTLPTDPRDDLRLGDAAARVFPGCGLRFERTIGTDDELADVALAELIERRPDLFPDGEGRSRAPLPCALTLARSVLRAFGFLPDLRRLKLRVALVSELDTAYGRSWKRLLDGAAVRAGVADRVRIDLCAQYMRGIDGRLPGEVGSADPASATGAEPATGEGQKDYVRRLERLFVEEPYDAIGILGTDVYDKIALLGVLRPRVPDAIFFTTDVDARLMPHLASRDTLDLVVASHHGLLLCEELQSDLPPFRSAYQVASFLAARRALEPDVGEGGGAGYRPRAHAFEVGRTWIHRLEQGAPTEAEASGIAGRAPQPWLFRRGGRNLAGVLAALALLAFGVACTWAFRARPELRRNWHRLRRALAGFRLQTLRAPEPSPRNVRRLLFGLAGLLLLVGLLELFQHMQRHAESRQGEPFFVVEGISSWPTIWLRILALALSVVGYFVMWKQLSGDLARTERDVFGASRDAPEAVPAAWRELRRRTGYWRVTLISLAAALVHYRIAGLLFRNFGGGHVPVRGEEDFIVERFVLWLCVLLFNWLVFFVMYVSLQVSRFAGELRRAVREDAGGAWPAAALEGRPEEARLDRDARAARHTVELVRDLGTRVGGFVWWPSVALFLMVVSRASLFDRWGWSFALVITFTTSFVLLLIVGQHVRSAARGVRDACLGVLETERLRTMDQGPVRRRLEVVMQELNALRRGVFAPIWEHPLLKAWLLPLAALGTNTMLEVFLPRLLDYA